MAKQLKSETTQKSVSKKKSKTGSKNKTKSQERKEMLEAKGYVTKQLEIPKETADLINQLATKGKMKVGDVVIEAIDALAEKYGLERTSEKPVNILTVNTKIEKLNTLLLSFIKMYFKASEVNERFNKLIAYFKNEAAAGRKIKNAEFYMDLPQNIARLLPDYDIYITFLNMFAKDIRKKA